MTELLAELENLSEKWRGQSSEKHWESAYAVGRSDQREVCARELSALLTQARAAQPPTSQLNIPYGLESETAQLVIDFASAMAEKLFAAQQKYGYDIGWKENDWLDECRKKLKEHTLKGDPRDVANYCAFLWYHHQLTSVEALHLGHQSPNPDCELCLAVQNSAQPPDNPRCFCPDCGADLGNFYSNRIRMERTAQPPISNPAALRLMEDIEKMVTLECGCTVDEQVVDLCARHYGQWRNSLSPAQPSVEAAVRRVETIVEDLRRHGIDSPTMQADAAAIETLLRTVREGQRTAGEIIEECAKYIDDCNERMPRFDKSGWTNEQLTELLMGIAKYFRALKSRYFAAPAAPLSELTACEKELCEAAHEVLNYAGLDHWLDDETRGSLDVWAIRKEDLLDLRAALTSSLRSGGREAELGEALRDLVHTIDCRREFEPETQYLERKALEKARAALATPGAGTPAAKEEK
jgi:hypothetical protein